MTIQRNTVCDGCGVIIRTGEKFVGGYIEEELAEDDEDSEDARPEGLRCVHFDMCGVCFSKPVALAGLIERGRARRRRRYRNPPPPEPTKPTNDSSDA